MGLSFNDEEFFKEAVGSLNFNNPPSDPDSLQGVGSSSIIPPQGGVRTRIFVSIIPQVIRISYLKFGECQWEVVVVLVVRHPKRGVKILKRY